MNGAHVLSFNAYGRDWYLKIATGRTRFIKQASKATKFESYADAKAAWSKVAAAYSVKGWNVHPFPLAKLTRKNPYVIQNPDNNLLWNRHGQYWSSERGGDYTTYSTAPRAEAAIRRNEYLRHRGLIVKADPASQRPAGLP